MSNSYERTRQVGRRIATAVVGIFVLTILSVSAQGDRSERLQEKVKSSNNRLDLSQMNTPPPINSMPQQALRKAIEKVKRTQEQLAEAKASFSEARKRAHDREAEQIIAQEKTRVKTARDELAKANAEVIEAREAVRIEQRR
jgi:hypothetical protein